MNFCARNETRTSGWCDVRYVMCGMLMYELCMPQQIQEIQTYCTRGPTRRGTCTPSRPMHAASRRVLICENANEEGAPGACATGPRGRCITRTAHIGRICRCTVYLAVCNASPWHRTCGAAHHLRDSMFNIQRSTFNTQWYGVQMAMVGRPASKELGVAARRIRRRCRRGANLSLDV